MKLKKIIINLLPISIATIPIISVVSCSSNTTNESNVLSSTILPAINAKQIKLNINFQKEINDYNLNDFDSRQTYSLEVIESETTNSSNKEYFDSLKTTIKSTKIEFVDYVIPKLEDDENTYLIFNLKYKTEIQKIYFRLSDVIILNQDVNLKKLTSEEIKNSIKNHLNKTKNFVQDFSYFIKRQMENQIDVESTSTMIKQSSEELFNFLRIPLTNYLYRLDYFYDEYSNLYIEPNSFSIEYYDYLTYKIKFKISTSFNNQEYYEINMPFVVSEKFGLADELKKVNEGEFNNSNINIEQAMKEATKDPNSLKEYLNLTSYENSISPNGTIFNAPISSNYSLEIEFSEEINANELNKLTFKVYLKDEVSEKVSSTKTIIINKTT